MDGAWLLRSMSSRQKIKDAVLTAFMSCDATECQQAGRFHQCEITLTMTGMYDARISE
jgi:hypothetical protein